MDNNENYGFDGCADDSPANKKEVSKLFKRIQLSTWDVIVDPFLDFLTYPISIIADLCGSERIFPWRQKMYEMETTIDKYHEQLEITHLLDRINSSSALTKHLVRGK
jgi:hypothetical protein